jgi:hypothetical protein
LRYGATGGQRAELSRPESSSPLLVHAPAERRVVRKKAKKAGFREEAGHLTS